MSLAPAARLALLLICAATPLSARAQEVPIRFDCNFPSLGGGGTFPIEFVYDPTTRQGFMVGNNGVAPIATITGTGAWSFIETLATGAVQVTVVTQSGEAIHSRHSLIQGRFVPSQGVGRCSIRASGRR